MSTVTATANGRLFTAATTKEELDREMSTLVAECEATFANDPAAVRRVVKEYERQKLAIASTVSI